jgi:hypothetical protein
MNNVQKLNNCIVACTVVAMQWPQDGLGRHVPITRQLQQLDYNNGKGDVFYVAVPRSYLEDNWGNPVSYQFRSVQGGWEEMALKLSWQFSCGVLTSGQRRDHRSWRISIVKIRYQEKTTESRLRRPSA